MVQRTALVLLLLLAPAAARALSVAEALAAEKLIGEVDAMEPAARARFIAAHRAELNQALLTEQLLGTIRHTVQMTALAAQHIYQRPLMCGLVAEDQNGDDEQEVGGRPPLPPPSPLPQMVAAFNAELKATLRLAEGPQTEARLAQIDVTDVIANRMIADQKCVK